MDEIAEKGFAAHWKYKEHSQENQFDIWISQIRELLENQNENSLELIDDFKLNLFAEDIYVFTPNGDMINLPNGASALDFAFAIHTEVGYHCLGAKVNSKLIPLSHQLSSGDQVEILTSNKQKPKEDWLNFVKTHKAKAKIKSSLKEEKKLIAQEGKHLLDKEFKKLKIAYENISLSELQSFYKVPSSFELYYQVAQGTIDLRHLKGFEVKKGVLRRKKSFQKRVKNYFTHKKQTKQTSIITNPKNTTLVLGDNMEKLDYTLANCCHPIPGDEVFGFITVTEGIKIHKTNCPNAVQLFSNYAYRVLKARWIDKNEIPFITGLKIIGIDDVGIVL